jgi:dipeptidyl aminopeptidase/acylaminoacyl peptidase
MRTFSDRTAAALFGFAVVFATVTTPPPPALAQGTRNDYERAAHLWQRTRAKVFRDHVQPQWFGDGNLFWYRVATGPNTCEFVLVDAVKGVRQPVFDHARLAEALAKAGIGNVRADRLPIRDLAFRLKEHQVDLRIDGQWWRCDPKTYDVRKLSPAERPKPPPRVQRRPDELRASINTGEETEITFVNRTKGEVQLFWVDPNGNRISYGNIQARQERRQPTFAGHVWQVVGEKNNTLDVVMAEEDPLEVEITGSRASASAVQPNRRERHRPHGASPDGKWLALGRKNNVWVKNLESGDEYSLSKEGTAEESYGDRFFWSPDSKKVVAVRTRKGQQRKVYFVESSPSDQIQPRLHSHNYLKPGDRIDQDRPQLFDLATKQHIEVSDELFSNPWSITDIRWSPDSRRFTFLYNQRGHQVMRIVAVDATSGAARAIVDEKSKTFIDYCQKEFHQFLDETHEIVWMSERDGWNHLYLYNADSGVVKDQITKGRWVVRGVDRVDAESRQIWFRAGGIRPEQDPYYIHYCRVNFDGSGLAVLTDGDGTHRIEYSPDGRFFLDSYSRVDLPPVIELRRAADGKRVCELERADGRRLLATGWRAPEWFSAKGRDGATDIYGVIWRPTNFDPKKKYPIIEDIYAGPQDSYVPKSFQAHYNDQSLAELGFIVVKIDGMGTSNRSKRFHDMCFKNLGDAGLPDRIAWIRAAAAKYPCLDLSRVGIFGGSAGGQNAARALMTHGDFYKVAVADCGCHDNRMDKIWWNEQWMGWPVGPEYAESSNVAYASKLSGRLLLIVGELDTNVDPASTMQVVNALIKADKDFDLLVIPGSNHGAAESPYGSRRRADYFVRNLLGVEPRTR